MTPKGTGRLDILPIPETDRVHKGRWPFKRASFQQMLSNGRVEARHWPESLPNDLPPLPPSAPPYRRYRLKYCWNSSVPILAVISCNPSKATQSQLDDTLWVTVNQAALWGFGGIDQCNLNPVYETDSARMHQTMDLDDPKSWAAINEILRHDTVWLAWGSKPSNCKGALNDRWRDAEQKALRLVYERQNDGLHVLVCRLITKNSFHTPGHPSPRRFPRTLPPKIYAYPLAVAIKADCRASSETRKGSGLPSSRRA